MLLFFSRRDRCTLSSLLCFRLDLYVFSSCFICGGECTSYNGVSEGFFLFVWVGGGRGGWVYLKYLPKEVKTRTILPLGLLHADPVCWHPRSSYAAMVGAHQGDWNPTLDVSTRIWVGLLPLGGQATGYPFQGSRCLHLQQPVHRGNKGGELPMLLEASLQIHLFLPFLRLVETFLRRLCLISEGVSVHDTHVMNTVDSLLPEVLDKKASLLFRDLWSCYLLTGFIFVGPDRRELRPPHGATRIY